MKKTKNLKFNKKVKILFILLFIYILVRLFFLFSVNLYNLEESRVGTITHELIIGPSLPIFDYPFLLGMHYPGRLLSGFLTVPFYLIFGESGISIKLMLLTLSAGIFCLVYVFLERFFSKKAAVITALLMIFSIPVYTMSTLSQGGPHLENAFFEILIMFLFYNIFFGKKQNIKSFILFGLACGFAIFVNPASLVMIFTCLLFWFIFDKMFFLRKSFLAFILSFFMGLIPFIYYNIFYKSVGLFYRGYHGFFLLKVLGNELSFFRIVNILSKFKNFILYDLPNSFMFNDVFFINSKVFSHTYLFIFIFTFTFILYLRKKSILKIFLSIFTKNKNKINPLEIKEIFILVYIIVFFLIYSISSFWVDTSGFGANGYRYLITFYVFIFIIISLFLTKMWNNKKKFISIFLLILLIIFSLTGNLNLVSFQDIGKGIFYKPYSYLHLGHLNEGRQCQYLNENYKSLCYGGYAFFVKCRLTQFNIDHAIKEINEISDDYKGMWYKGLGHFLYCYRPDDMNAYDLILNKSDERYKYYFYRGIGIIYGEEKLKNSPFEFQQDDLKPYFKQAFFEGFGESIGEYLGVIPTQAIRQCNKVDEEYRPYCFKGLGWSLAEKFGDNPSEAGKFAKYINYTPRDYFYKGIGSYIGLMFNHNITMAEEECNKLGNNSFYCLQGLDE